jgi:hypothetical protein
VTTLVNCAGCNRHIRRSEALCPFCGIGVTSEVAGASERARPSARLGRAALLVFAAAAGSTACSGKIITETSDAPPLGSGGASNRDAGGAVGSGGAGGEIPTNGASLFPGNTPGSGDFAQFYGAPPLIMPPGTGGVQGTGDGDASGSATASKSTTHDAGSDDAGPADGSTGDGGLEP